jgi:hypothetical protein
MPVSKDLPMIMLNYKYYGLFWVLEYMAVWILNYFSIVVLIILPLLSESFYDNMAYFFAK